MSFGECCRPVCARRRNNLQQGGGRTGIRNVLELVRIGYIGRTTGNPMGTSFLSFSSSGGDAAWLPGRLAERFFLSDFLALLGRGHLACGLWCFGGHATRWATVGDAALFALLSAAWFAGAGVYPLFFEPALEVGSGFCFADSHYLFFFFFLLLPQLAAPTFRHLAMAPEAYALGKTR